MVQVRPRRPVCAHRSLVAPRTIAACSSWASACRRQIELQRERLVFHDSRPLADANGTGHRDFVSIHRQSFGKLQREFAPTVRLREAILAVAADPGNSGTGDWATDLINQRAARIAVSASTIGGNSNPLALP